MTISSNNIYIKHWVNIILMFFSVYRRIFFPSGTSCQCFKFSQSRRELALFKALAEFKASRRLGKYIRCFKCFCISVGQNSLFTSLQMSEEPYLLSSCSSGPLGCCLLLVSVRLFCSRRCDGLIIGRASGNSCLMAAIRLASDGWSLNMSLS